MDDRTLLEKAAKAMGLSNAEWGWADSTGRRWDTDVLHYRNDKGIRCAFVPLTDDGDALRLAVKLGMWLYIGAGSGSSTDAQLPDISKLEPHDCDPYAATRRAIVRAAAELGKDAKGEVE